MIRRWLPHAVLAIIAFALLWQLERGEGGRLELSALQERVALQEAENAKLEQRNQSLAADVAELKSGEAAVEDRARAELGMIKPGETFYRVVESGVVESGTVGGRDTETPADATSGATATDEPGE